jgi:hypothetical protein
MSRNRNRWCTRGTGSKARPLHYCYYPCSCAWESRREEDGDYGGWPGAETSDLSSFYLFPVAMLWHPTRVVAVWPCLCFLEAKTIERPVQNAPWPGACYSPPVRTEQSVRQFPAQTIIPAVPSMALQRALCGKRCAESSFRTCLVTSILFQIPPCKKKISRHIKISANVWSTKCWWN